MRVWDQIREWGTSVCLVLFLVIGFSYSHWHRSDTDTLRQDTIKGCQRGVAKAILFQQFANEAASARRDSAAAEEAAGESVRAANDIATAVGYEAIGRNYMALTPNNCEALYGPK